MIAKVCSEHDILVAPEDSDFREICADILFNRTKLSPSESTTIFLELLNHLKRETAEQLVQDDIPEDTLVNNFYD